MSFDPDSSLGIWPRELGSLQGVLLNQPRIRFAQKGHTEGDHVYAAFGQTVAGRFLSVFFIFELIQKLAIIISARDMSLKERKAYGRK